ncbi:MAG: ribosome small subunit-dependent GTPase A [Gammaproteobacteria bacterium]|nr:ribosome small subunit-dependent GTPase A [Gammaproteobacteria bacterium]MCW5583601.1 ribosome small subunit-dependent GTPase A [Gammaproteobacteria bacterium]
MSKPIEQYSKSAQNGLIISYFGNSVAVEAEGGQVFQCHLRRNQELPVVGDKVRWQLEYDNTGVIIDIEPRSTLLARGDARGKMKPIVANVDVIIITMAPPPIFSEYLIDRYLVAAELLKIHPILVLNKVDLLSDAIKEEMKECLAPYQTIPYSVVLSSIYVEDGLDELNTQLQGKTGVLVGPSGVGKSSIIAILSKEEEIRVGMVSAKGIGKHTTTATRLYHLPHGGKLIDSPGVREFNLWPINKKDVLHGFKEFQHYLHGCKFRDCLHVAEPGCAVQAAVISGKISAQRYANYQDLIKEASSHNKY